MFGSGRIFSTSPCLNQIEEETSSKDSAEEYANRIVEVAPTSSPFCFFPSCTTADCRSRKWCNDYIGNMPLRPYIVMAILRPNNYAFDQLMQLVRIKFKDFTCQSRRLLVRGNISK
eukprot:TRINITY_DN31646_c0_g2_i2.p2 TRINITY_DN31646_c0_g2~~TRINITY_DN31646_c0_g2_i2.p2  ORF type:complete len:116 (+),score=6.45 TRINITY_DN31646_c0_g2_i2:111-458(+)